MSNWTLFSNHGHVLVCLAGDSEARLRDVAADVGITERAVQKIVRDLQTQGMISVTKHGRRNRYRIHKKKNLRHDLEAHCTLGDLIKLVTSTRPGEKSASNEYAGKVEGISTEPLVSAARAARDVAQDTAMSVPEPAVTVPLEASPLETEPVEAKPAETEPSKPKSAKSIAADLIQKQQGSLF